MQLELKVHKIQATALNSLFKPNINNQINEVLFGGAKNGGKSFLGCLYEIPLCMNSNMQNLSFFIARHTRKDLIDYTIPTIHKFFRGNGLNIDDYCKYNGQTNAYTFNKTGSRILLIDTAYTPSDPMYERFGSMEMTGGWIEEGGEHHELAYENLKLSIGRQNNDTYNIPKSILITCNPKKNWMYRNFVKPSYAGTLPPNKTFIQSLVTDNVFRASGSEDILNQIKNKRDLQRLRFGVWEYDDSDNALVSFDKISDLFHNTFVQKTGKRMLSCDIALLNDKSVLIAWDGMVIIGVKVFHKLTSEQLKNNIIEAAKQYEVPNSNIIYDGDGIGLYLNGLIPGALKFNNNGASGLPEFSNIKTRLAYMLADAINKGQIFIDCVLPLETKELIVEDLQCLKAKDSERKMELITKDDMKKIIGRSPDFLDAIMYRMLFIISRHY